MVGAFDSPIGLDTCTKLEVYNAWGATMQKAYSDASAGWKASCSRRNCTVDEWQDRGETLAVCRQKAQMTVLASSEIAVLEMTLYKSASVRAVSQSIELRLKSGDVLDDADHRIHWTAAVGSASSWLSLSSLNGSLHSSASAAEVRATASGAGLGDTATTGAMTMGIAFHCSAALMSNSDFVNGTGVRTITVRLNVFAVPYVNETHVTITRSSDRRVGPGGPVDAGDQLTVTVKAFDAEGLPIARPDLPLRLDIWGNLNKNHSTPLTQAGNFTNTYKATIPELWVREPETVRSDVLPRRATNDPFAIVRRLSLHLLKFKTNCRMRFGSISVPRPRARPSGDLLEHAGRHF
jgi:hypothetical protein